MAVIHPPVEELGALASRLGAAGMEVAHALARLDQEWVVYVAPRIGLERPDFLAVHERFGACSITVRDWTALTHQTTQAGRIVFREMAGNWSAVAHPRSIAARHRTALYDRHVARPGEPDSPDDTIRAIVVLPGCSTDQARELLVHPSATPDERTISVWGGDALTRSVDDIVRGEGAPARDLAGTFERITSRIVPAGHDGAAELLPTVALSAAQRAVADGPPNGMARRARGPAGSGKSVALAARAARLAAEGQQVLALTFSVTMANHLDDLVTARCREYGADATAVTCANFHSFCEHIVHEAELVGIQAVTFPGKRFADSIVAMATHVVRAGFEYPFDAVLIDEGQDFTPAWVNLLRTHLLRPGGELLLVADPQQDLYGRHGWDDDGQAIEAGLTEPWIELDDSLRMPRDLAALTVRFGDEQIFGMHRPTPRPVTAESPASAEPAGGVIGRWINLPGPTQLGREVGREVVRLLDDHPELDATDVVFVCEHHPDGVAAVEEIERAGYPVHHVFSRDPEDQRRIRRYRLRPGSDSVTGCTIHSFKGLTARALVMGIDTETRSKLGAYMAMTRVGSTPGGESFLSVVNGDPRVADFATVFESSLTPDLAEVVQWAAPLAEQRVG